MSRLFPSLFSTFSFSFTFGSTSVDLTRAQGKSCSISVWFSLVAVAVALAIPPILFPVVLRAAPSPPTAFSPCRESFHQSSCDICCLYTVRCFSIVSTLPDLAAILTSASPPLLNGCYCIKLIFTLRGTSVARRNRYPPRLKLCRWLFKEFLN